MYVCTNCITINQDSDVSCWFCYTITCLACRQTHGTEWLLRPRGMSHIMDSAARQTFTPRKLHNDLGEYEFTVGNGDAQHFDCCGQGGESEFYGGGDEGVPVWMPQMAMRLVFVDLHYDLEYVQGEEEDWEEDLSCMLWDEGGFDVEFPIM